MSLAQIDVIELNETFTAQAWLCCATWGWPTTTGKSRQYVTLATALIEAPDWLLDLYREGRCKGMAELHELRRLHGEHPQTIEAWCSEHESITRSGVAALRAELTGATSGATGTEPELGPKVLDAGASEASSDSAPSVPPLQATPHRQCNTGLHVELDGQSYQLVVSVAPQLKGHLYVRPLTGGPRRLVGWHQPHL